MEGTRPESQMQSEQPVYNFKDKLDTRDEAIRVPFNVKIHASSSQEQLETSFLEWLTTIVENIFSVSFRYILESKLTILEGKAFASKNILLNIKETCEAIHEHLDVMIDDDFMAFLNKNLK